MERTLDIDISLVNDVAFVTARENETGLSRLFVYQKGDEDTFDTQIGEEIRSWIELMREEEEDK